MIKKFTKRFLISGLLLIFGSLAHSQTFKWKGLIPANTVCQTQTPPDRPQTVLFDDLTADSQTESEGAKKSCWVLIPLEIPEGFQVTLAMQFKGFVHASTKGRALFQAASFLGSFPGPKVKSTFLGPQSNSFELRTGFEPKEIWTPCAWKGPLRLQLNFSTQGNALAVLEEATFHVERFRPCH